MSLFSTCHVRILFKQAFGTRVGYPLLVRPSYVLSGAAMSVVTDPTSLASLFAKALKASPEHPVVVSKYYEGTTKIDVAV